VASGIVTVGATGPAHRPATRSPTGDDVRVAGHCIFCQLIESDSARWAIKRDAAVAFLPLDPLAPGHTLVAPRRHSRDLSDIGEGDLAATM
jgi:galactose-1-phosphate uridylyltransferase